MNPERAKQLENFLLENPLDAFTKYALALEYIGTDDQRAARLFEEVLLENPGYLPPIIMPLNCLLSWGAGPMPYLPMRRG